MRFKHTSSQTRHRQTMFSKVWFRGGETLLDGPMVPEASLLPDLIGCETIG